jgi:hypothetical protein
MTTTTTPKASAAKTAPTKTVETPKVEASKAQAKPKPRTPQYSWMNEPVPQAWIDRDPDYFTRLDNQITMIREAAVPNGWDLSGLSDREIHLLVWRTRSDEAAVKRVAEHLASLVAARSEVEKA